MGLSTHVLDTMHGCPAAGMEIALYKMDSGTPQLVRRCTLNRDGRTDQPLYDNQTLVPGRYRLEFEVDAYFRAKGADLPQPGFLGTVPLDFGIADPTQHYHVPLLVSPWSYSTYRGS